MDIFVKCSKFMSRGGAFDSLFCPEGRVFVHNEYLGGGGFLLPSSRVPEGMVLDKMDTCITFTSSCQSNIAFLILQSGHSIQGSLINNKGYGEAKTMRQKHYLLMKQRQL